MDQDASSYAYALVHAKYTIPPALLLTFLFQPLWSPIDTYKILFHIIVAVAYTTPWDSYLIRNGIWSYPSHAVLGYTLFDIPLEELFFFVIQTYITSLLYLLLGKVVFHPAHVYGKLESTRTRWIGRVGMAVLAGIFWISLQAVRAGGKGTYLGLICVWASPVLLLIWSLSYSHIISLPQSNTLLPIALPTLYLWVVDTFALRRGTWVISHATKLGIYVWPGLEIEEAVFFLVTNLILVCGLTCAEHYVAVLISFPSLFPSLPPRPSAKLLVQGIATSRSSYPQERQIGMKDAVDRLRGKSRSFWVASSAFDGRLRVDLLMLYSFCRVADDLIDDAPSYAAASDALRSLQRFLDLAYASPPPSDTLNTFIKTTFPPHYHSAFFLLPTSYLPREPLDELLEGFLTDLSFTKPPNEKDDYTMDGGPLVNVLIKSEADLKLYALRVAGTVAELCLRLVFHYCPGEVDPETQAQLVEKGIEMGVALQYVNIARDIEVDARMRPGARVYLPQVWMDEVGLDAADVVRCCSTRDPALSSSKRKEDGEIETKIESLRGRLLALGMKHYDASRGDVEDVPRTWGARRGMRVAVESYVEIGRALVREMEAGKMGVREDGARPGKVPSWRRAWVAWRALKEG